MSGRSENILVAIVRGSPPKFHPSITLQELYALEQKRSDIAVERVEADGGGQTHVVAYKLSRTKNAPYLTLINGFLEIEDPDIDTMYWMLSLASDLDARVQRHDLRTYRTPTETYVHPDDEAGLKIYQRRLAVARNRWIPFQHTVIKYALMGFVLLVIIGYQVASHLENRN